MMERFGPNVVGITLVLLLSVAGVLADAVLKVASGKSNVTMNVYFVVGALMYAATAFGWVWAMRHLKLAQLGAFYAVMTALLLAVVGVLFFKETLKWKEVLGIALGVVSLILLTDRSEEKPAAEEKKAAESSSALPASPEAKRTAANRPSRGKDSPSARRPTGFSAASALPPASPIALHLLTERGK